MLQIKTAPAAAMGVAMVQSGRDRVAVITKMNTAHIAAGRTGCAIDQITKNNRHFTLDAHQLG